MTETAGFAEPEPDESQAAEPVAEVEAEAVPEPDPGSDVQDAPVPVEAVPEPPPTAPFIPDTGVPDWLRDALLYYDQRHRNAGF